MEIFGLFSLLITLAALFAYLNQRFLKLPAAIGLMGMGLLLSLGVIGLGKYFPNFEQKVQSLLYEVDFSNFLLDILLCFLLFAGSLHVKLPLLFTLRKQIIAYATIGVLLSTFLVGLGTFWLLGWLSQPIPLISALIFGALISPTDPIAVLGILKKANVPKKIETEIVGESLFNDGTGLVVFLSLLEMARLGARNVGIGDISLLLLQEAGGGILLGLILGWLGLRLMASIDHYQTEVLLSLALVMGGYSLANIWHLSGPLAMVVAGLIVGNQGKQRVMSDVTADYLDKFWELVDEILNALLFVLIGLEFLIIPFENRYILTGILTTFIVLMARFIAVGIPLFLFNPGKKDNLSILLLLTWGGLRGGISIALALSTYSQVKGSSQIMVMAYTVVLFSVLVQGLSIEKLIKLLRINQTT
jgi:CPA1 family monovalent cation:H+ antiporter